jgi:hypothetical protein
VNCKYCGSDSHSSKVCPTRNLVRLLTGKKSNPVIPLPALVVTDEEHLISTVDEVHALKTSIRRKVSDLEKEGNK